MIRPYVPQMLLLVCLFSSPFLSEALLKCYSYTRSTDSSSPIDYTTVDCGPTGSGQTSYCYKYYAERQNDEGRLVFIETRRCGDDLSCPRSGCKNTTFHMQCCCSTDFCNAAVSGRSLLLIVILSFTTRLFA